MFPFRFSRRPTTKFPAQSAIGKAIMKDEDTKKMVDSLNPLDSAGGFSWKGLGASLLKAPGAIADWASKTAPKVFTWADKGIETVKKIPVVGNTVANLLAPVVAEGKAVANEAVDIFQGAKDLVNTGKGLYEQGKQTLEKTGTKGGPTVGQAIDKFKDLYAQGRQALKDPRLTGMPA